jgi:hypothetical protein
VLGRRRARRERASATHSSTPPKQARVVVPLVDSSGLWLGTRAKPHGADLMGNAPADWRGRVPWMLSGQRISSALPWYRGAAGGPMECGSAALCQLVEAKRRSRSSLEKPARVDAPCSSVSYFYILAHSKTNQAGVERPEDIKPLVGSAAVAMSA